MVTFEDHFWGEKNAGFDVLYHNMKYGNNASCKLMEFIRERSTVEETYAKALLKLSKSATPVTQLGTFEPLWGVLRVATEKLANAHWQVVQRFQELIKELKEYGEKQKEKHKQAKEDFSSTLDIVQMIQTMTANLAKSKETYYARCQELDKLKKDGSSAKDIEKAETKTKKAEDDYRNLVEKREIIRNDFHDKMVVASKKFQEIDEEHLKKIISYLEEYINSQRSGQALVEQVYDEFIGQVKALTVGHLLDQFVRSKGTGKAIPGVITFEEFTGQVESTISSENSPSLHTKPASAFPLTLKRREKKEKKKKVRKEKAQNGPVDSPSSEGGDHSSSFEVDEEGYTIRHDSHSENAKSGGNSSSSDSDSDDDDEPCRLQVVINPVGVDKAPQTASVDEIKKISGTLSLSSPSSARRNLASSSGEGFRSRARSTGNSNIKLSRSSDDLLDIDFSQTSLPSSSESSTSGLQRNSHMFSQNGLPPISSTDTELRTQSSGDLRSLPSVMQSSPSVDSSESTEGDNEVAPVLPTKKGSMSLSSLSGDLSDIPPPLPVKQGTFSETKATFPADFSFVGASDTEPTSSEMGIIFTASEKSKAAPADSSSNSSSVPFIKPPPTSEIPRSASVSSALPRPRPQQRNSATALFVPGQTTKPASTTSYSAELFSCLADFTPTTTTAVNAQNAKSNALSSESGTVTTSSTSLDMVTSGTNSAVSKAPVVNYLGSTTGMQTLNRATTTSALEGTQENVPSMVRSKTVGGMPTMSSVVFAKGAAGTVSGRKDDTIPIAVAFIESVNALFRGSDQNKCMVKVTGDITVSFPASVLPLIFDVERVPMLSFLVRGTSSLEQLLPNKALIISEGQLSGGDGVSYKFNMASLADHLKKQSEQGPSSFYNIDIIKYEVKTSGFLTTPLQLCSYWKCEEDSTDLRLDYRYNPSCMSAPCSIANLSVLVPVTGGVSIMQSKPSATWSAEHQRALWKLQEISNTSETQGSLRAKFDLTQGPGTPSRIAVQFTCNGATVSKLNFELKTQEYKLSLVKKRFATGKYTAES